MTFCVKCHAIQPITEKEREILHVFFHKLVEDTETGYVLEGKKPICTICLHPEALIVPTILYHDLQIALWRGIDIWERIAKEEKNTVSLQKSATPEGSNGLLVINNVLLRKTVEENLPLFQYVLGPSLTPDIFLEELLAKGIVLSPHNNNKILSGILLGYGVKNSLFGSRYEEIQEAALSMDQPPYQSSLQKIPISAQLYKHQLLNQTVPSSNVNIASLQPSLGFSDIHEEFRYLQEHLTLSSPSLVQQKPTLIFGRCKDDKVDDVWVATLEETQKELQKWLSAPDFFTIATQKFLGSSMILPSYEEREKASLPPDLDYDLLVAEGIWQFYQSIAKNEEIDTLQFLAGLTAEETPKPTTPLQLFQPRNRQMVLQAQHNVEHSHRFFSALDKNSSWQCIVPNQLYYRIQKEGTGPPQQEESLLLLDYEVFNPAQERLQFSPTSTFIDLSETIPGFAHGVQGMRQGETREIYVHPSLAYGIHTFLEKGIPLRFVVTLLAFDPDQKKPLPPLAPLDMSSISDPQFFEKCERFWAQKSFFSGKRLREKLLRFPRVNLARVIGFLENFSNKKTPFLELDPKEKEALLTFYWEEYFPQ